MKEKKEIGIIILIILILGLNKKIEDYKECFSMFQKNSKKRSYDTNKSKRRRKKNIYIRMEMKIRL